MCECIYYIIMSTYLFHSKRKRDRFGELTIAARA